MTTVDDHLDVEPLELWLRVHHPEATSDATKGAICGVARGTYLKWRRGGMTAWRADDVAIKVMGRMPWEVWDRWEALANRLAGVGEEDETDGH